MSVEEAAPSFACESCSREFRWKPAIAGKSAKCGCGATVQVPATEPGKPQPALDDDDNNIFGQLEAVVAAAPVRVPPPIPDRDMDVAPPRVSSSKKTAAALAGGGKAKAAPATIGKGKAGSAKSKDPRFIQRASVGLTKEEFDDMRNMSFWGHPKERIVPFIMLGISMFVFFGTVAFQGTIEGEGLVFWTIYSILCAVGLTAAAFVTAGVAGMSFGIMGIGILRLMAISYTCLAINVICYHIPYSGFVDSALTYAIFTFGLMGFFGLEYAETRIVAFVSVVLKFLLLFVAIFIGDKIGTSSSSDDEDWEDEDVPAHVSKDKTSSAADKDAAKDEDDEKDALPK